MYDVSAEGVGKCMINVRYYYNLILRWQDTADAEIRSGRSRPGCRESGRIAKGSGVCQNIALHA